MSRERPFLADVVLVAVSTLATLLAAELFLRITWDPRSELSADTIWQTQSATEYADADSTWAVLQRFRFREEPVDPGLFGRDVRRVLFLGDSFTEGSGIAHREDRFTDRVERALGGRAHVFNAARGGTMPADWRLFYEVVGPAYRPDLVVAVFFLRDGTSLETALKPNRETIEAIRSKHFSRPLAGRSRLVRWICNRLAWKEFSDGLKRRMLDSYLGTDEQREMWRIQQGALRSIARQCREKGVPFHLVVFPVLANLDRYEFGEVEEEIARFAERNDIPVFSLTPAFLGRNARDLWVANNDQHPNELGHRIAAEALLPYLEPLVAGGS